jgi:recombination protein RecR
MKMMRISFALPFLGLALSLRPWHRKRSRRWQALARLPGLGPRSARRAVLWLVKRRETALVQLLEALARADRLVECRHLRQCRYQPTPAASAPIRAAMRASLCVVEDVADLWALDRARLFTGRYHVLGGGFPRSTACGPRTSRSTA